MTEPITIDVFPLLQILDYAIRLALGTFLVLGFVGGLILFGLAIRELLRGEERG